jgi:hypothetical protein
MEYTYIIFLIGVITIVYASLSTLRTIDIKELIAYSSVSHAAVYLLGVFSNSIQGIEGAITLGLAHGFVSPGLFICAGGVLYDRSHTRVISFYRGVSQVMPLFAILFFILCLANCGAPLTLNFIGEFLSLYGVFERSSLYGVFASSSIIFSAAYTIYMFQRIAFGGAYSRMFTVVMPDLTKREFTILMILTVPTVILGIYPSLITDGLAYGVSLLLYNFDNMTDLVGFFSATISLNTKNEAKVYQGEQDSYYDIKGNSGDPNVDECQNDPNKEHRLAQSYPADYEGDSPTSGSCERCEDKLEYARDTYESCIKCGMELCTSCGDVVINGTNSNLLLFIVAGDIPVLFVVSFIARLLFNKLYRNALLSAYYLYKNKA